MMVLPMFIFVIGLIYIGIGITAYGHLASGKSGDKMLAASPWWALYGSIYDDRGKKLCTFGRGIIIMDLVALSAWLAIYWR